MFLCTILIQGGGWPSFCALCGRLGISVVVQTKNPRPVSPKTGETRAGHPRGKIRKKGWASPRKGGVPGKGSKTRIIEIETEFCWLSSHPSQKARAGRTLRCWLRLRRLAD